ncbi:unnamed protein product [Dimorphilus gyrociliatus]|uniref:Large ribosomal subunit protein mL40 n=1 Tax=Dimorphilus gyrociliatus TaxID=2664684 RepID=A0A7I8W102_9ANNE|nr:unnamed protein product [Dimorphilus gyrociliatus]
MMALRKFWQRSVHIIQNTAIYTPAANFHTSEALCSAPMKKKRKLDINIVIQKEIKKKRKLEKQIRRLEAKGRILKPIDEIVGDRSIMKTIESRKRPTDNENSKNEEEVKALQRRWANYKFDQHVKETKQISDAIDCQNEALIELRKISEDLYQLAIQTDNDLVPFKRIGPVSTPPISNYNPPDGEYIDTTRKYDK